MSYMPFILSVLMLLIPFHSFAQKDTVEMIESGKTLFRTHCTPCHSVHQEVNGPMLASITRKRSEKWLIAFIRNSQQMILSGDEYANFLYKQYNRVVMPSFEKLSEEQVKEMLLYIEKESEYPAEDIVSFPEKYYHYSKEKVVEGKILYNNHCASCHLIGQDDYGPSLGSITKRRPLPWLISFIKNPREMIQAGDPYAVFLFENYEYNLMPAFDYLEREEIMAILEYIEFKSSSPPPVAGVNARKIITPPTSGLQTKGSPESPEEAGLGFKIIFVLISTAGATIHAYLIVKLYLYLAKRTKGK